MKYEKTILKDFPDNSVFCAFVGIPWNNELANAASLAGYWWKYFPKVRDFKDYFEKNIIPNSHKEYFKKDWNTPSEIDILMTSAGYKYSGYNRDNFIPLDEAKYCTLDGLRYFQKRKDKPEPYFQGLQLIREVKSNKLIKNLAVYDDIPKVQVDMLGADFIPKWKDDREEIPYNFYEYLRTKNT